MQEVIVLSPVNLGLQGQVSSLPCCIGWSTSRIPPFLPIQSGLFVMLIFFFLLFFFLLEKKTKDSGSRDDYNKIVTSGLNCQPVCSCGEEQQKDCSLLLALPTIITPNQIMVTPCSVQLFGFPDSNTSQMESGPVSIPPDVYSKTLRVQSPHRTAYANLVFNKWFGWAKVNRQGRHQWK